MFDHLQEQRKTTPSIHPVYLMVAVLGMLGATAGIVYSCLWLLSQLGLTNLIPPVEVHFDPYGDGTTLESLLGEGERPPPLTDSSEPPQAP